MVRQPNRKHSKIDALTPELRETVEQMLLSGSTYSSIVQYLQEQGIGLSVASVCRYARAYAANVEQLAIAQENFRHMMNELEKYPDLDTTEAITRIASQQMLNALAGASEDEWKAVGVDKLMAQANGLIRAAAYKKRVETQNQDVSDAGFDAVKGALFEAMAKEQPELYRKVVSYLRAKQETIK